MACVRPSASDVIEHLERDGYYVVQGMITPENADFLKAELKPSFDECKKGRNIFEGSKTQRVYAVHDKTRGFDVLTVDPLVLEVVETILESKYFALSSAIAINILPGQTPQPIHTDDGGYPIKRPHQEIVVNTMWALDDFTESNGATLVLPRTHTKMVPGCKRYDGGDITQGSARYTSTSDATDIDDHEQVKAVMPKGSVMFYLGSLLHGGGANTTSTPRLGVILEYVSSWLKTQENNVLSISPTVVARLEPKLQELLGYYIHPPFFGVVNGKHPRRVLAQL
eukprot:m.70370 g.70370  ORF g.70370 m.70370 type:complete len:282 (-) comp24217_c0_seq1:107-952(-)